MSLTARAPNGTVWYLYASDATPTLSSTTNPSAQVAAEALQAPVQLSSDATKAWEWTVSNTGVFSRKAREIPDAYLKTPPEFISPGGSSFAVKLDNNGDITTEDFHLGGRHTTYIVMLVGGIDRSYKAYVPDTRFPSPPDVRRGRIGGRRY